MVYAPTRSVNAELNEGATDGKYKKVITDRGGFPETTTYRERAELDDIWFGIHEKPVKVRPDGKVVVTPDFVYTRPVDLVSE